MTTLLQALERRRSRIPYAEIVPQPRKKVRFSQVFWANWAALIVVVGAIGFMVAIKFMFDYVEGVGLLSNVLYWVSLIGFLVACWALTVSAYEDATRE